MPSTLKYFSADPCDGDCSGPIERTSANTLIIRDVPKGIYHDKLIMNTEIDCAAGTIKKTWRAFVFKWHKVYTLDNYSTAEIQDKSRLIEGYPLHFYAVYLSGGGHSLKIYSTDDLKEAEAVRNEVAAFLAKFDVSTVKT